MMTPEEITETADAVAQFDKPVAITAHQDRGHIVLTTDHPDREAVFADLGSVLHLWSGQGAILDPKLARELGKALIGWADKKDRPPFDLMVTLTGDALDYLPLAEDGLYPPVDKIRLALDEGTFKVKVGENGMWSPPLTDGVLIQEGHEIP